MRRRERGTWTLPVTLQCELKPAGPFHMSRQRAATWGGRLSRGRCGRAGRQQTSKPARATDWGHDLSAPRGWPATALPGHWCLSEGKAQVLGATL